MRRASLLNRSSYFDTHTLFKDGVLVITGLFFIPYFVIVGQPTHASTKDMDKMYSSDEYCS